MWSIDRHQITNQDGVVIAEVFAGVIDCPETLEFVEGAMTAAPLMYFALCDLLVDIEDGAASVPSETLAKIQAALAAVEGGE